MHLFLAHIHTYLDKYVFFILVNIFLKYLTVDNPNLLVSYNNFRSNPNLFNIGWYRSAYIFYTCQDVTMIRGFHNISLFEH